MSSPPLGWEHGTQSNAALPSSVPGSPPEEGSLNSSSLQLDPQTVHPHAGLSGAPARGFLHIVRHNKGDSAVYVVTCRRLDRPDAPPRPILAEGPRTLIDVLERLGVDLRLSEVRGALKDVLRLGSANILDLWLSDEQMNATDWLKE